MAAAISVMFAFTRGEEKRKKEKAKEKVSGTLTGTEMERMLFHPDAPILISHNVSILCNSLKTQSTAASGCQNPCFPLLP